MNEYIESINNENYPICLSESAYSQLDKKLDRNFDNPGTFSLMVEWLREFMYCLNNLPIKIQELKWNGKYWCFNLSFFDDVLGTAYISVLKDDIYEKKCLRIESFSFIDTGKYESITDSILRGKNGKELLEFHSWMKRLDEVKGARPTYWCE